MRYVIDTNVVVSGLLRPSSKPGRILDLMLEGDLPFVSSTELIEEYREVLLRPKFGFEATLVDALVDELESLSIAVVPQPQAEVRSQDPDDQFVTDLAQAAGAAIVTGNARHFTAYEHVLSPAEALLELAGA